MQANWQSNENKNPLELYGRNLTKLASENKMDPVIGRDNEIRRIINILSRKSKNNPILIGDPGVGKTAVVEGLAQKIIEKSVPEDLKNKQIYEIDLSSVLAGASYQGQFEERLKSIIKAIEESNGNIIVFIDEIHMLIGAGKNQGAMDAANIFKPIMARGGIKLIGATTLNEYREYIEKDPALERRMQKVFVKEPSLEESLTILRGLKERFENFHKVKIDDNALIGAVQLSNRYITDRFLPDKAIDLIDEAAARIKNEMNYQPEELEKIKQKISNLKMEKASIKQKKSEEAKNRSIEINEKLNELNQQAEKINKKWSKEKEIINSIVDLKQKIENNKYKMNLLQSEGKYKEASEIAYSILPNLEKELSNLEKIAFEDKLVKDKIEFEDIANIVAQWTKIDVSKLITKDQQKILNLETSLNNRVKGQQTAAKNISDVIKRSKAGVNDPNRPIGSFLFMGPTGVGKTQIALSLADNIFDSSKEVIRLNMSEYMEKHSVSKIIGSPPGYIGYEQGGQLTEKVRLKPYSIILFDEIEKAHPDVLNILLQILDAGEVQDSKGRLINFKNTIIIMTSNLGSEQILNNETKMNDQEIQKLLLNFFKPELINRIDKIIVFDSLSIETVTEVAKLELQLLSKRIWENIKIKISFDDSVAEWIVGKSYDKNFGARPIKRFIQNNIESYIADYLISTNKDIKSIDISIKNDAIKIN